MARDVESPDAEPALPDADLRAMMRDPRYWDGTRPGSGAWRQAVTQGWAQRYPGQAQHDGSGQYVYGSDYTRMVERHGQMVEEHVSGYVQWRDGGDGGSDASPSASASGVGREMPPEGGLASAQVVENRR